MRTFFTSLCFFCLTLSTVCAQQCRNFGDVTISTDPANPYPPYNSSLSDNSRTNTFDWTQLYIPFIDGQNCYAPGYQGRLVNPFWDAGNVPLGITKGALSDYQPKDGWELIKRDFGYIMAPGQMTYPVPDQLKLATPSSAAYIMLYNRFTSTLRIIATLGTGYTTAQSISYKLFMPATSGSTFGTPSTGISGLLNAGGAEQALEEITKEGISVSAGRAPTVCNIFSYADFPLAYDPCTCRNPSNIIVRFDAFTSSTLVANGASIGLSTAIFDYFDAHPGDYQWLTDYFYGIAGKSDRKSVV